MRRSGRLSVRGVRGRRPLRPRRRRGRDAAAPSASSPRPRGAAAASRRRIAPRSPRAARPGRESGARSGRSSAFAARPSPSPCVTTFPGTAADGLPRGRSAGGAAGGRRNVRAAGGDPQAFRERKRFPESCHPPAGFAALSLAAFGERFCGGEAGCNDAPLPGSLVGAVRWDRTDAAPCEGRGGPGALCALGRANGGFGRPRRACPEFCHLPVANLTFPYVRGKIDVPLCSGANLG